MATPRCIALITGIAIPTIVIITAMIATVMTAVTGMDGGTITVIEGVIVPAASPVSKAGHTAVATLDRTGAMASPVRVQEGRVRAATGDAEPTAQAWAGTAFRGRIA
jgi:hypothetical protein